jgi:hypothetical protein
MFTSGAPRRAVREDDTVLDTARATLTLCKVQLGATLLLSRFAIPLGGDRQVPVSFVVGLLLFAALAALTKGAFSPRRLIATAVAVTVVFLETLLAHKHFSALSVLYVVAIYAPLVLTTSLNPAVYMSQLWRSFITLASFLGVLSMLQVAVQIVHPGLFLDPIALTPERFLLANYNTTYPVMRGVLDLLKPNGMFTLEPSIISQVLGLGLLGELAFFRRPGRIALLMAALVTTFSGTGLLIVLGSLLFLANVRATVAVLAVAGVAAAIIAASGYGEAFASRMTELSQPGTSGHERFVAPFSAVVDSWSEHPKTALFGYGAGQVTNIDNGLDANYSAIPKVALEYGLVGLGAFVVMWATMFQGLGMRRTLVVALMLYYFLASGALLQPFTVFSMWALSLGFARKAGASAAWVGTKRPEAGRFREG